jgi:uracil-DNA glycosylase
MKETWQILYEPLSDDIQKVLQKINLSDVECCPSIDNIFKCFTYFDVTETKVVIVGQDPYHTKNTATGLSFQSNSTVIPPSLKNIFKAVKHYYTDAACDIESWAKQGVLMFNRALTVELNKPNSHCKLWKSITNRMICLLSDHMKNQNKKIVFMLWGNNAKELISFIDIDYHIILTHTHPSPLSRKSFYTCDHFVECNKVYNILW